MIAAFIIAFINDILQYFFCHEIIFELEEILFRLANKTLILEKY